MKYTKYIVIFFAFITLYLSSCTVQYEINENENPDEIKSTDSDFVETEENYYNNMTETTEGVSDISCNPFAYKYSNRIVIPEYFGLDYYINEKTGNIVNTNTDPLYTYDENSYQNLDVYEVFFLETPEAIKYHNNAIYYIDGVFHSDGMSYEICSVTADGQNKEIYYTSGNFIFNIFPYDNYLYFTAQGQDGNIEIYKLNYKTKDVKPILFNEKNRGYGSVYESDDAIFCTKSYTLIKTNMEFSTEEIIEVHASSILSDGKYLYYTVPNLLKSDVLLTNDLYKYNIETGEKIKLYENVWAFQITDNNIYFTKKVTKLVPNPDPQPGDKNLYDRFDGKIYRIDKDGNNEALIRDDSDVYFYENFAVYGDYIYMRYYDYSENLYTIYLETYGDERQSYVRYGRVRIDSPESKIYVLKKPE